MKPDRRASYLRALGVDVWVPKTTLAVSPSSGALAVEVGAGTQVGNDAAPASTAATIFVETGTSDTLLLCRSRGEGGTMLARDIARSLKCEPVWGWPVPGGSPNGFSLEQAIRDRLITRLVVFGSDLTVADGAETASVIGTAEALRVASLPQLARSAKARRDLWEALNIRQWCGARARVFSLSPSGGSEG